MRSVGDQFVIVSELPVASGGMADVFKARDIRRERDVAVKLFRVGETDADLAQESFRRESDALTELRHPNIVELVRADIDGATGRYFLALEWVPSNLEQWLSTIDTQDPAQWGWDTFVERIGLPVARAIDFAHQRGCIHRDIKPLNILMTSDGQPKVADFGIAKLKTLLDPGYTLAQFMTEPYSPAEHDHGEFCETRDVYAFGVLAVRCLSGERPKAHADVRNLLNGKVNAPPEALSLLASCLSPAVDQRPRTGGVLLQRLADLHEQRSRARERQGQCFLALTHRARQRADELFGVMDGQDLAQLIGDDLNELCAIKPHCEALAKGGKPVPHQYDLLGSTVSLHAAVDERTGAHLVVIGMSRPHSATLERLRESAWKPAFTFRVGHPASIGEGANIIERLERGVRDYEDRSADAGDLEVHRLTERWTKVLKAKRAVEQARYEPVEYDRVTVDGTRAVFHLAQPLDAPPDDGLWRADRSFFRGELDACERQSITLYHPAAGTFAIPHAGTLRVDTQAAEEPLRRQERALEDLRAGRGLRSDAGDLLTHPARVRKPAPVDVTAFAIKDLDEPKKKAVRAALGTPDVLLVKGPPGTGKTSFIAETIVQERRRNPHVRVLLTSQTHIAIDNAVERLIKHDKTVRVVRWASDPDRVLKGVQPLLLENRVADWVQSVKGQSEKFLQDWGARHGVDPEAVRRSLLLRRVLASRSRARDLGAKLSEAERLLRGDVVPDSRTGVDDAAAEEAAANVAVYKEALTRAQISRRRAEDDLRGIDGDGAGLLKKPEPELTELADRLLPRDEAGKQLQQLLVLHEQYVQRLENPRDIQGIVLSDHDVVAATCVGLGGMFDFRELEFDLCIIDEASKATATEVVIPISRSRRTILVGDERQLPPFHGDLLDDRSMLDRFDLSVADVEETVFGRFSAHAPKEAVVELDLQHRMTRPIGDMISQVFYSGRLRSARDGVAPYVASAFGRALVWLSSSKLREKDEEPDGTSFVNSVEVRLVVNALRQLEKARKDTKEVCSVLVLSGYYAQQVQLAEAVRGIESEFPHLSVEVNTVDAAQGREAEVAIFSVVRSNERREPGFLARAERINVALSRAQELLILVGDHEFCHQLDDPNPMRRIADYFRATRADATVLVQEESR